MANPWDAYLGDEDREVIARGRFGRRMGFGERPAILVIDVQKFRIGEADAPRDGPSNSGRGGHEALPQIRRVIDAAHAADVPCFFAVFELDRQGRDIGVYRRKRDMLETEHWCLEGSVGAALHPEMDVGPKDIVYVKKKPSGFHGTPLLGYLVERGVDTVIVMGGSTSNCVRATVFDASSHNFRTIVVREGVFDRLPISHAISLFDMDRQFADVVPVEEVLAYLGRAAG